jgi:hypothetical protein
MTHNRRLLAGAFGLAILVAACGGTTSSGSSSPTPAATVAPAATAAGGEATEAPEMTEEPAATDDGGVIATVPPEALNGLAASLPETANGIAYQRAGYDGDQFGLFGAMAGVDDAQLGEILKKHGKTIDDLNFAVASPANSSDTTGGMVMAIQVEGVDASEWIGELGDMPSQEMTTVGGKQVYGQAAGGFGIFVYPKGDTMYMLLLMDEQQAGAILEQLP